jgi:hypothetical protein
MKRFGVMRMLIMAAAFVCGFGSFESAQDGFALTIQSAEARVGRPATPESVAGVARRQTRRAVVEAPLWVRRLPVPHASACW